MTTYCLPMAQTVPLQWHSALSNGRSRFLERVAREELALRADNPSIREVSSPFHQQRSDVAKHAATALVIIYQNDQKENIR